MGNNKLKLKLNSIFRVGWQDYHEKFGRKAVSENPIVNPFDSSLKPGLRSCLSE